MLVGALISVLFALVCFAAGWIIGLKLGDIANKIYYFFNNK